MPSASPNGSRIFMTDERKPLEGFVAIEEVSVGGQGAVVGGTQPLAHT